MNRLLIATALMTACHVAPSATAPRMDTQPAAIAQLATRRAQAISWLHEYTEASVFPTDALGRPLSVFEDEHGVRCPMAELIYRSGRADLVESTKREHNTVRLRDVTSGPLHDWMSGSGLTRDEIAMVQGAMDINYSWMRENGNAPMLARIDRASLAARLQAAGRAEMLAEQARAQARAEVLAARAQARGRLETAERALRDGTRHVLAEAAAAPAQARPSGPAVAARAPVRQ